MRDAASLGSLTRLGRYLLVRKLAEGGIGAVHAALRDGAPGLCVLKVLREKVASDDIAAKRFYREARLHGMLDHPRIARVHGAGVEDETFCMAMELVPGVDLAHVHRTLRVQGASLAPSMAIRLLLDVLDGLDHAHELRDARGQALDIVHRDLTFRNVMVEFDGRAKLIDFGLVRGGVDDLRTRTGAFLGTPRFASPEQVMGTTIDRRTDLYSASVVLFELLTGAPVVRPGKLASMFASVVHQDPPLAHTINASLPAELSEVLAKALAKNRDHRWPTARAYSEALRDASGPLATGEPEEIGAFVRDRFRADVERVWDLLSFGEQLASQWSGPPLEVADPVVPVDLAEEPLVTTFVDFVPTEIHTRRVQLSRPVGPRPRPSWGLMGAVVAATAVVVSGATYFAVSGPATELISTPAPTIAIDAPAVVGAVAAPPSRSPQPAVTAAPRPTRPPAATIAPETPSPPPPAASPQAAPAPADPRIALDAIERRAGRLQSSLTDAAKVDEVLRIRQRAFRALSSKRDDAQLAEIVRTLERELTALER